MRNFAALDPNNAKNQVKQLKTTSALQRIPYKSVRSRKRERKKKQFDVERQTNPDCCSRELFNWEVDAMIIIRRLLGALDA